MPFIPILIDVSQCHRVHSIHFDECSGRNLFMNIESNVETDNSMVHVRLSIILGTKVRSEQSNIHGDKKLIGFEDACVAHAREIGVNMCDGRILCGYVRMTDCHLS